MADDKNADGFVNDRNANNIDAAHTASDPIDSLVAIPPFLGSYDHTIDGKGRIIAPANYRKRLGDKFAIGPTKDVSAIALYPYAAWYKLMRDLDVIRQSPQSAKSSVARYLDQFSRLMFPECESDGQGRILLPAKLRNRFLGDVREVEISGSFDHIKIVSSTKAAAEDALFDDERVSTMDVIAEIFANHRAEENDKLKEP